MSGLLEQSGLTLVETLVVTVLSIIVLGGILTTFTEFEDVNKDKVRQNEAQEEARRTVDRVQKELRSLASPTNELPQAVEKAQGADLVFQAIAKTKPQGSLNARNAHRVRYCLNTGTKKLWRQTQTWTTASAPALPATASCPEAPSSGNWDAGTVVAHDVTNGTGRAVFTYNATALDEITEVAVKLHVDVDPNTRPAETTIASGAFLRNQNRKPTASFTATVSGSSIVLNGSDSTDPEGRALAYKWYDGATEVGEGIVFTYTPAAAGDHTMQLKVIDPAGLESLAPTQTVCVPGPGTPCP